MFHHIDDVEGVKAYLDNRIVEFANAITLDNTQHKRAFRRGASTYVVSRRYLQETVWQTVYEGDDLNEAVMAYNRLS